MLARPRRVAWSTAPPTRAPSATAPPTWWPPSTPTPTASRRRAGSARPSSTRSLTWCRALDAIVLRALPARRRLQRLIDGRAPPRAAGLRQRRPGLRPRLAPTGDGRDRHRPGGLPDLGVWFAYMAQVNATMKACAGALTTGTALQQPDGRLLPRTARSRRPQLPRPAAAGLLPGAAGRQAGRRAGGRAGRSRSATSAARRRTPRLRDRRPAPWPGCSTGPRRAAPVVGSLDVLGERRSSSHATASRS